MCKQVHYLDTEAAIDDAMRALKAYLDGQEDRVLGFDCEWPMLQPVWPIEWSVRRATCAALCLLALICGEVGKEGGSSYALILT
jgi:hypothetical protein